MARFDSYPNPGAQADTTLYLLDVQSDLLDGLDSRVASPLRKLGHFAKVKLPTRLTPVLQVVGKNYLLETPKLGSVTRHFLKASVACLADEQDQITSVMDFLSQCY